MASDRAPTSVRSRKRSRFSFSGEHLGLDEIDRYHNDIEVSVRYYFALENVGLNARFLGCTPEEIEGEMLSTLDENERNSSLNILAALEAAFRVDFIQRCQGRKRDALSGVFRDVYQKKGLRVSLEDDIFSSWRQIHPELKPYVSSLTSALKYRHWLAHGRYWTRKWGKEYDYQEIYSLAQSTFDTFPFKGDVNHGRFGNAPRTHA